MTDDRTYEVERNRITGFGAIVKQIDPLSMRVIEEKEVLLKEAPDNFFVRLNESSDELIKFEILEGRKTFRQTYIIAVRSEDVLYARIQDIVLENNHSRYMAKGKEQVTGMIREQLEAVLSQL